MPRSAANAIPRAPTLALALLVSPGLLACDAGQDALDRADAAESLEADRPDRADRPGDAMRPAPGDPADRPLSRSDTIRIEGMPEPLTLRLFRTPGDFPLPFSAYVPADMAADTEVPGGPADSASVRFVAEFGGTRNEEAFLHLFVFPEGTGREQAAAYARAYRARSGIPVSRGVEPIAEPPSQAPSPDWAVESYRFRVQAEDGWHIGLVGIGQHDRRFFLLVRHYPPEYGDGLEPRADLITETWRWVDGSSLGGATSSAATGSMPTAGHARPGG